MHACMDIVIFVVAKDNEMSVQVAYMLVKMQRCTSPSRRIWFRRGFCSFSFVCRCRG